MSTLLVLESLVGALRGGAVYAAPGKSPAQDNVVISEFRTRGPNGESDEFIELFNPTLGDIPIGGWQVLGSSDTPVISLIVAINAGVILHPGQHYLIANSIGYLGSGSAAPDQTYTTDIADDGGIALYEADGVTSADQVGLSGGSAFQEHPPLDGNLYHSYERKPGGDSGSCYDSNDNSYDFSPVTTNHPQNLDSEITVCAAPTDTPTFTPINTATFTPSSTDVPTITSTPTDTPITPTVTSTRTHTNTPTASRTATSTPSAPSHLVISEFRSRGPLGEDDEFVELYNPTGAAVNMGAWTIRRSGSCGTSTANLVILPADTILLAGQHYLVAATGSSVADAADQTYPAGIADDGGVALVSYFDTVVDQAGMCASTQYHERTTLSPLSGPSNQSYERKPGGATSCYDTNSNNADFMLASPAKPQNTDSSIVMCAGVHPSTPTSTRTTTSAPTAFPGIVVINEFLPHPHTDWNGDGTANTGDEYIELINMGTESISLKNWKLDDGVGGSSPYTLPNMTLLPRQIAVFYQTLTGISLSDGGDTVRLFKPDGRTADIYTYPLVTAADRTWCRLPNGTGGWAFTCRPSPGKPNTPLQPGTPGPGSTPLGGVGDDTGSACLMDLVPQAIQSAECNSPGAKMRGEPGSGVIWLESRWKWDVFVK